MLEWVSGSSPFPVLVFSSFFSKHVFSWGVCERLLNYLPISLYITDLLLCCETVLSLILLVCNHVESSVLSRVFCWVYVPRAH